MSPNRREEEVCRHDMGKVRHGNAGGQKGGKQGLGETALYEVTTQDQRPEKSEIRNQKATAACALAIGYIE